MILLVIIAAVIYIVITYNSLIQKAEAVDNSKRQIDVQLDGRFKIFQGLIGTVKKVMDYEQTVLKDIVQLRSQAQAAKTKHDDKTQFLAEEKISKIAGQIGVVFEQYPQLGAIGNAQHLQEEISSTEKRLTASKQAYNDAIEDFNVTKKSFFASMVVKLFASKLDKNYEYWQLSTSKHKELDESVAQF
jgi:LemA protein